jgi:hypothetical protein
MIELRLPSDFDLITNIYAKNEHRGDETKHGGRYI